MADIGTYYIYEASKILQFPLPLIIMQHSLTPLKTTKTIVKRLNIRFQQAVCDSQNYAFFFLQRFSMTCVSCIVYIILDRLAISLYL